MASRFSIWVTGAGIDWGPNENTEIIREKAPLPLPFGKWPSRGIIVIALYGHWVAQSPQPIHVDGLISTSPFGKRAIAPVGQPVRHSASWQCMQTEGTG